MQEYAPDEQKELQDKAWGSNTGTMPWCNDSSHLHRVSVEVQMYLEGDLQEIEVTSQEPSCADLAWHHGTTAPWHHGTMAEAFAWSMSPMLFSGNSTKTSVPVLEAVCDHLNHLYHMYHL